MQTASQIIAAKRAAKQARQNHKLIDQQIGNGNYKTGNDRKTAAIHRLQTQNCRDLRDSSHPVMSYDAQLNSAIRNELMLQDLIYQHDAQTIHQFYKLISYARVYTKLYTANGAERVALNTDINQAQRSLEQSHQHRDRSPNQRRLLLAPIGTLNMHLDHINSQIPERTATVIGAYVAAVHSMQAMQQIYSYPLENYAALRRIINGDSLRSLAKGSGIKEPQLRSNILEIAHLLHQIAQNYKHAATPVYAHGIPDLRHPSWQIYSEKDITITQMAELARRHLIEFEDRTGISLIDYRSLKQTVKQLI